MYRQKSMPITLKYLVLVLALGLSSCANHHASAQTPPEVRGETRPSVSEEKTAAFRKEFPQPVVLTMIFLLKKFFFWLNFSTVSNRMKYCNASIARWP